MEFLTTVSNNWDTIVVTILSIIGGASIIVSALAPLTKTYKGDDKVASVLKTIHAALSKVSLDSSSKKEE